ncbi:MAG: lipopolysaccharide biosynthesis protein [Sphingosinicella sp.]|nr:lipopolysaccharide biosynthesis protein [Sphingosinicella sp.]
MIRSASIKSLRKAGLAGLRSPTGRSIMLYALAFVFAGLTPFVLLPVLTRQLDPAEFGQAASWIILSAMIANVCGLTTHGLISVRFFKLDRERLRRLISTALAVVMAVHAALVLYMLIGPDLFSGFTHLPARYSIGAAAVAMVISLNLAGLALMQVSNRPGLYLSLRMLQSAVEIGGCLLLLRLLAATPDVRIISYGAAAGASAFCAIAFIAAQGFLGRSPDRSSVGDVLRFGVPMVPHVLAGQLLSNLDRLMVSYLLGVKELGIFMVASQLGMALSLVIEPLNRALAPWLFERLAAPGEGDRDKIVRWTYGIFAGLFMIALLSAGAFILVFDYAFTRDYSAAKLLVLPVAIGMTFQGMYYGVVNYIFYAEATARLSLVSSATVSLGVLSSYFLVSHFGLAGASLSFMLTNAALFFAVWHLSRKVVDMPWFCPGGANK